MSIQTTPTESNPELPAPSQSATADHEPATPRVDATVVLDDLLVEDVSIDGMCGVY
jgi:mycofactocin precursor